MFSFIYLFIFEKKKKTGLSFKIRFRVYVGVFDLETFSRQFFPLDSCSNENKLLKVMYSLVQNRNNIPICIGLMYA